MYNYFMLIGRICNDIEVQEVSEGKRVVNLRLAVNREFKNVNGEYITDFFNISLWEFLADVANDHFRKGALVGIKGRISQREVTLEGGTKIKVPDLVGERIVFFGDAPAQRTEKNDTEIEG